MVRKGPDSALTIAVGVCCDLCNLQHLQAVRLPGFTPFGACTEKS